MERYRTVKKAATTESVIERSRFIAHVAPVPDRESADEFVREIKSRYKDATHNVPAMVIGDKQQIQWASDDGEPQGTSGPPIVQLIVSEGLTNVAVVVTRYFGGIKLGTGGLVRAYTGSARKAIEEAGICSVCDVSLIKFAVDYSSFERLRKSASEEISDDPDSFVIEDVEYIDKVVMTLIVQNEGRDGLVQMITNVTGGKGKVTEEKSVLRRIEFKS